MSDCKTQSGPDCTTCSKQALCRKLRDISTLSRLVEAISEAEVPADKTTMFALITLATALAHKEHVSQDELLGMVTTAFKDEVLRIMTETAVEAVEEAQPSGARTSSRYDVHQRANSAVERLVEQALMSLPDSHTKH